MDRKVNFIIEELDDTALSYGPRRAIKEVLTQLIRNAVYHGIESPEERVSQGKTPEGEIRLSIKCKKGQIIIKISDDGDGIDFNRIRQIATASNLPFNQERANDRNYLINMIFAPGFSTLGEADLHAGRGIGLSLVRERVRSLNGVIAVTTAKRKGTSFTISIPMDIAAEEHAS